MLKIEVRHAIHKEILEKCPSAKEDIIRDMFIEFGKEMHEKSALNILESDCSSDKKLLTIKGFVMTESEAKHKKDALNVAVSAIYFNDKSDYLRALYSIVELLSDTDNLEIDKLFKALNPE